MARPASGTNLTIAQLQRVLNEKQTELNKLHRQRENLQRKIDLIDRQIERVDGSGGGQAVMACLTPAAQARTAPALLTVTRRS